MANNEVKIMLIGARSCGKTSFLIQFQHNLFVPDTEPNLVEDSVRLTKNFNGTELILDFLDAPGDDEIMTMATSWVRISNGFICMYSINFRKSFERIANYLPEISKIKGYSDIPLILVGNKCDLENERQVNYEEGKLLSEQFKCEFFETSSKARYNISEVVEALVDRIQKKRDGIPNVDNNISNNSGTIGSCTFM